MDEDLNHFAGYQKFSTYATLTNDLDTPSKTQSLKRNPLEYYTKRGLDPPKTIHGDPTKIFDQQNPQKQDQAKETNINVGSVQNCVSEINRLYLEVGNLIFKPQETDNQLRHKKHSSQQQIINNPKGSMQIQSLRQITFQNDQVPQIQKPYQEDQEKKSCRLRQELKLSISPQNQQIDWLKQQGLISQQRDEQQLQQFQAKKNIHQLYQRHNKPVLSVEEQLKQTKNKQRTLGGSIAELAKHQDEEIQKAIYILNGGLKKSQS